MCVELIRVCTTVCGYVAAIIGVGRAAQHGLTPEEVQHSLLVEQGTAILSLHCHRRPPAAEDKDDEELTFIAPTASKLKLQ